MKAGNDKYWFSDDILMDILSRVPARSLLCLRCVCKRWCSLLTKNPHFINMHLTHAHKHTPSLLVVNKDTNHVPQLNLYSFSDRDTGVLNPIATITGKKPRHPTIPCNGLICLIGEIDIILLNLTTRESVTILKPSHMGKMIWKWVSFGFQPSSNKYVLIWPSQRTCHDQHHLNGHTRKRFELLTLDGSNSCRQSADEVCYTFYSNDNICIDGIMYYLVDLDHNELFTGVVSFDLESAKFREVPVPACTKEGNIYYYHLYNFQGKLCMTHHAPKGCRKPSMDIWILEDPVNNIWIKKCKVYLPRVGWYFNNQFFLTLYNGHALLRNKDGLSCCVIDEEDSFQLLDNENIENTHLIYTYMETLVKMPVTNSE